MRLHVSQSLLRADPDRALHALEICLAGVSSKTVSAGRQIMVWGLGPHPFSMNQEDFAVFVVDVERNATSIEADMIFQTSASLTDEVQYEAVRSKLDQVFYLVLARLGLDAASNTSTPATVEPPYHPIATSEPLAQPEAVIEASIQPEATLRTPVQPAATVAASMQPDATFETSSVEEEPLEFVPSQPFWDVTEETASAPLTSEPVAKQHHAAIPLAKNDSLHYKPSSLVLATIGALFLILTSAFLLHRHHSGSTPSALAPTPAITHDSSVHPTDRTQTATTDIPQVVPAEPTASAEQGITDPKIWLKHWENSMRTRDALAQCSFYTDPVDRYMYQIHLDKKTLQEEKQTSITKRRGLWTVKLEHIVIESQTRSNIKIRLVKHFIDQPAPSTISEHFVPTRLLLKWIDGGWKIQSEQDLS